MIAILRSDAPEGAISHILNALESKGFEARVCHAGQEAIIEVNGDPSRLDPLSLQSLEGVERVVETSEPFILASRASHPADTVVEVAGSKIGSGEFQVIAGPCSVEEKGLIDIARRCKMAGATMLRGGAYKPRTSPYDFQGMGERGLDLLLEAKAETGMPIVTEVMDTRDVELFVNRGIDVVQVGARNAQNFSLLKEVGRAGLPVLLKRGVAGTIDELLLAAEYILSEGNDQVMLCERGIRTFETRTRNTFDVSAIPVLHQLSHLPVVADPSHATGHARYVEPMALAAVAAGADALEIEVHDDPARAWSDGTQALTPDRLAHVMGQIRAIRTALFERDEFGT